AMALAERVSPVKTKRFFVDHEVHPQTLAVLRTRAEPLGWSLVVGDPLVSLEGTEVFGALLQYPGTSGTVRDLRSAIAAVRRPVAWRCRPASSISAARKRPPTSAPRRCCWQ